MSFAIASLFNKQTLQRQSGLLFLLGLLPLLAASDSFIKAVTIGVATIATLLVSLSLAVLLRSQLPPAIRVPALVVLTGGLTLCSELVLQAWFFSVYASMDFVVPWVVANCLLLTGIADSADTHTTASSLRYAGKTALGIVLALLITGLLHEVTGSTLQLPVALLLLAVVVAVKNSLARHFRPAAINGGSNVSEPGSKRVRVTGKI